MKAWSVIFAVLAVAALLCALFRDASWTAVVFMMAAMSAAAWYDADPRNEEEGESWER